MRARPPWTGLGVCIVALVVLAVLLVGGLVGLLAARSSEEALRTVILSRNLVTADLAAELVAHYVDDAQTTVRIMADMDVVVRAVETDTPELAKSALVSALQQNQHLDDLGIVDLDGTIRINALPSPQNIGGSVVDRDWFQHVVATGQPYRGRPVISRVSGRPVVPYAVPIRDSRGVTRGVLIGGVSLAALSETVTQIRPGESARTGLGDSEHQLLLSHVDQTRILQPFTGRNPAARRAVAGERGTMESTDSGGEIALASFSPVPGLPWTILIQQPSEEAFAPVDALLLQILVAVSGASLLAAALGAWLAFQVTRPLSQLRTAALAIAAGNLGYRVVVRGGGEVGDLGRAFNQMAAQLQVDQIHREQVEAALDQSREAEARMEGVSLAAREMAHLLNNSLALPVAALDLARQETLSPGVRALVEQAVDSLEQAKTSIRQFQQVVRVETKQTAIGPALDLERSVHPDIAAPLPA